MDKLKMAHEVACAMIANGCSMHTAMADAWRYADAMQAEADKRKPMVQVGYPKPIESKIGGVVHIESFEDGVIFKTNNKPVFPTLKGVDDFHIDWSQAPEDANWWVVDTDGNASWFVGKPSGDAGYWDVNDNSSVYLATSFNYGGLWQDSLRKRPQEDSQ